MNLLLIGFEREVYVIYSHMNNRFEICCFWCRLFCNSQTKVVGTSIFDIIIAHSFDHLLLLEYLDVMHRYSCL